MSDRCYCGQVCDLNASPIRDSDGNPICNACQELIRERQAVQRLREIQYVTDMLNWGAS
jgi:hypothetical protein